MNNDDLAAQIAARITQTAPVPYDSLIGIAIDDTSGGTDVLKRFYLSPFARSLAMVQIMMSQTSGAGVYRTDGSAIKAEGDGLFLPSGGGVLYLRTIDEVRNFRIRANDGATMTLSAQAFRFGDIRPDAPR